MHALPSFAFSAVAVLLGTIARGDAWTEPFDSGVGRLTQTDGAGGGRFAWNGGLHAIDATFHRYSTTDRRYAPLGVPLDAHSSVLHFSAVVSPLGGDGESVRANGFVGFLSSAGDASHGMIGANMSQWTEHGGGRSITIQGYYDSGVAVNPAGEPPSISFDFGSTYYLEGILDGPNSLFQLTVYQGTGPTGIHLGTTSHILNPSEPLFIDGVGVSNICSCGGERTLHAIIDDIGFSETTPITPVAHVGSADPQTEGWILGSQDGTSAPIHGDLGYVEAWRLETDTPNAECYYDYPLSGGWVDDALEHGWGLSVVVRVRRSDAGSGSVIYFASGSRVYSIQLRTDSNDDPVVGLIDEDMHSHTITGGADKYHVYQLRDLDGSGLVDLFVDGILVFSNVTTPPYPLPSPRITFGDVVGGLPVNSDAYYALIGFAIGQVDPAHGCVGDVVDCNGNAVLDPCDLQFGTSADCNNNGVPDECDLAFGSADDCNGNQIPDDCEGIVAVTFDPPSGAIDARQPTSLDGSVAFGWQLIDVTFNGPVFDLSATDFVVTQEGGEGLPPDVLFVLPKDEDSVSLLLSSPINLGAWTTITHSCSGANTIIGYLPGDVNGDGTTRPLDILALIDSLNGVGETRPIWATDIDRSAQSNPADILREIDLLNGAEAFDVWHGVTLP